MKNETDHQNIVDDDKPEKKATKKRAGRVIAKQLTGIAPVARNLSHLKYRARFPFASKVILGMKKASQNPLTTEVGPKVSDHDQRQLIKRSMFWHMFLIIVLTPLLVLSVLSLSKGLGHLVFNKNIGLLSNIYLWQGIGATLLISPRLFISIKSYMFFKQFADGNFHEQN